MDILKLAKHLKEFTIDEIEMIAECDVESEIERLLKEGKIVFENGVYKYQEEKQKQDYIVCSVQNTNFKIINFENAIEYFLENYVKKNCKNTTFRRYNAAFQYYILPFFKNKNLNNVKNDDISEFYYFCKDKNLPPKVLKNTLALLNQIIKYYQNLGIIDRTCIFQVRRLSDKTRFIDNQIIFEK